MFRHRFFVSFFITMCFYTLLVAALFYAQHLHVGTEQKPQEQIITMSLASYEPEVVPPPEELIVKEPVKEEPIPEPIEEVEPELEEPVVEEVIPEPVVEKIVPKPIVKKVVKKKVQKKKLVKKKVKKKKKKRVKKKVVKRKVRKKSSSKKSASPAKKNAYLSRIRSKINKNKAYPRIAKRRGMQGSVKVRFTILRSGKVGNISVSGPKVFHKSAKSAVRKSFPISTKNAPISLPMTVNFTLRYQIR